MAANHFTVKGERIDSQSDFLSREKNDEWRNLLYYPKEFKGGDDRPLVIKKKRFFEVSFKDTVLCKIRFDKCTFVRCLFIGSSVEDCEFTTCQFIETNTQKMKINRCLFDPKCFDNNFDLKVDTNIAIGLYQALYKNAINEHQSEYALESEYKMREAEDSHLSYKKRECLIDWKEYYPKKIFNLGYDFVAGYGLRTLRVFRLLGIVITFFSVLNYWLREYIFDNGEITSFIDAIYFTCVTITTLGFGDITPGTQFGKIFIAAQVLLGVLVISLFLSAVAGRILRAK